MPEVHTEHSSMDFYNARHSVYMNCSRSRDHSRFNHSTARFILVHDEIAHPFVWRTNKTCFKRKIYHDAAIRAQNQQPRVFVLVVYVLQKETILMNTQFTLCHCKTNRAPAVSAPGWHNRKYFQRQLYTSFKRLLL